MIRIEGDVEKLRKLGKLLKEAGDKELKQECAKAFQRATRDVKVQIKQSAVDTLPHSGGLNIWVAQIGIKTRIAYSGRFPGISITGTMDNKKAVSNPKMIGPLRPGEKRTRKVRTFGKRANLRKINAGTVRHPVFGHGPLKLQSVTPGFWDRPLKGVVGQRAKREVREAMQSVTQMVASRMRSAA